MNLPSEQSKVGASPKLIEARDKTIRERYGYSRRPEQSFELIKIPVALIEEAIAGIAPGDSRTILERALEKGTRF